MLNIPVYAAEVGPEPGKQAPLVELTDLEGKTVSLDQLKGKVILLNFWSTLLVIALTVLFTEACASTFVAYKDGRVIMGNGSNAAYKLFCESGDLRKILADTTKIGQEMKDELYWYNCGVERSSEKVKQLYASMTSEQRKDLRQSFKHNGYDINYMHC
jgi:hypothetical protein